MSILAWLCKAAFNGILAFLENYYVAYINTDKNICLDKEIPIIYTFTIFSYILDTIIQMRVLLRLIVYFWKINCIVIRTFY